LVGCWIEQSGDECFQAWGWGRARVCIFFRRAREFGGRRDFSALWAPRWPRVRHHFFPLPTCSSITRSQRLLLVPRSIIAARAAHKIWPAFRAVNWRGSAPGCGAQLLNVAVCAVGIRGFTRFRIASRPGSALFGGRLDGAPRIGFCLGRIGPALLLLWYGYVCYGSPFRPSTECKILCFIILGLFGDVQASALLGGSSGGIFYVALLLARFRHSVGAVLVFGRCCCSGWRGLFIWLRRRSVGGRGARLPGIFLFF